MRHGLDELTRFIMARAAAKRQEGRGMGEDVEYILTRTQRVGEDGVDI